MPDNYSWSAAVMNLFRRADSEAILTGKGLSRMLTLDKLNVTSLRIELSPRFKLSVKAGLAMVIAYYISLSMGWDESHWAGLAVGMCMLDTVGDSINKGFMRFFGTLLAGGIALFLASVFPQSRWCYLGCVALYMAFCTYMTGHSSRWYFWTVSGFVMTILALVGGHFGGTLFEVIVLRTQQTLMGIIVYTVVSIMLWPNWKSSEFIITLQTLVELQRKIISFNFTRGVDDGSFNKSRNQASGILMGLSSVIDGAEFDSFEVWETRHHWRRLAAVLTALHEATEYWRFGQADIKALELSRFILNLPRLESEIDSRLCAVSQMLTGGSPVHRAKKIDVEFELNPKVALSQFDRAALVQVYDKLCEINCLTYELYNLTADIRGFGPELSLESLSKTPGALVLDLDRLSYAVRTFVSIWTIFLFCIYIPAVPFPIGIIPILAVLSIMLSLRPEIPLRMLIAPILICATVGGGFHIMIMPHLHSFAGLAVGMFIVVFGINFMLYKVANGAFRGLGCSFFVMLSLIKNHQSYNFVFVLEYTLAFMIVLSILWLTSWIPISFQPYKVIFKLLHRFLISCEHLTAIVKPDSTKLLQSVKLSFHLHQLKVLPERIRRWMNALGPEKVTTEKTQALTSSLQELSFSMCELIKARELQHAESIKRVLLEDMHIWRLALQEVFHHLAVNLESEDMTVLRCRLDRNLASLESHIELAVNDVSEDMPSPEAVSNMYRILAAYRRASEALVKFTMNVADMDWTVIREGRF